jgi:hypothetical protein
VSHTDEGVLWPSSGNVPARLEDVEPDLEWADLRRGVEWVRAHRIAVIGFALILASLVLKAQFLSHLYFRQDDFHDLDLAIANPLDWRYVTFIGAGHLIIGLRVVAWLMVRISPYNWTLASLVSLAFVAAASIAALQLLRKLFGDRPAILIPLLVYVLCPLTLPDIGEWSSALESVPLQLAIFMAVSTHIDYVRTKRVLDLVKTAAWVIFGMAFFEKGVVIPLLLFALTASFLLEGKQTWLEGARQALVRFWRAWLLYLVIMIGYLIVLEVSLHTSTTQPGVPVSGSAVVTFVEWLLRYSFVPGVVGGPWQWLPVVGNSYSFAAPPPALVWFAVVAVLVVIVTSILRRPIAFRAWAILLGWVVVADMLPVTISRLGAFSPAVLGTETRYVADAVPVLAICLGLAFWPIGGRTPAEGQDPRRAQLLNLHRFSFDGIAVLLALFVFGSIWSVQAYESVTTGQPAASYMANAALAVAQAPRGTPVFDVAVPGNMVEGLFGSYALQSTVIGDIQPGKLDWIRKPSGTLDGLRMFGSNGKLYQVYVSGASSMPLRAGQKCWRHRNNQIVIRFRAASPAYTGILRLGYLWYSSAAGAVTVEYPTGSATISVKPGLHAAFVPISGSVRQVTIEDPADSLCVGDAQAGNFSPNPFGQVLPASHR